MQRFETKKLRRSGALVLSLTLAATAVFPTATPTVSEAAAKPALSAKKGTFLAGEAKTVTIKNVKKKNVKKLVVSTSKKAVATVKKSGKTALVITSKKAGKATIKAVVTLKNKKKYTLKYTATVKNSVDRKVTVFKTDRTSYKIPLRFFAGMPNVPYIRATEYYKDITGDKELKVKKTAEDEYLLTGASGDTATVNTATDVLTTEHYEAFTTARTAVEGAISANSMTNGAPFVLALPDEIQAPDQTVTIDFTKYDLDLKGDSDDIWMPVETAANLFVNGRGATMLYNGTNLYHIESLSAMVDRTFWEEHYEFSQNYVSRCPGGVRPKDLTEYAYNELMFMLDANYGNPGRCYFADAIREKGFDRALAETDDQTRAVREMLKSNQLLDYIMGLGILSDMLYDGGHTWFSNGILAAYMWLTGASQETFYQDFYADLYQYGAKIGYIPQHSPDPIDMDKYALAAAKGAMQWVDHAYQEKGDTAVYTFDSFSVDRTAWDDYYSSGCDPEKLPEDAYGDLIRNLNKAKASGNIKNFVLDVSGNGGGDEDALVAIMGILADDANLYVTNTKTGRKYVSSFKVDKNVDGKFDEKDDAVTYPFRFAILTSSTSFSCANLLPCYAKADGIMVIGERSSGGCCATISTGLGCGAFCMISRSKRITLKDGGDIDGGAAPDQEIEVKRDADGNADYSAFFDIEKLSGYINSFYK